MSPAIEVLRYRGLHALQRKVRADAYDAIAPCSYVYKKFLRGPAY